ncbi:hypothetical protein Zmor_000817 [Zophobas morio]|uniref:Uncharacterized protein n=1 Tax=Zophobas morio TaxID=2755281 RepID=A0AA38MRP3_9CUCU|nr:hypothetical protein Zmor_000817 [Zophobas morio]
MISDLIRLIPRVRGPTLEKRKILGSVTYQFYYTVHSEALKIENWRNKIKSTQKNLARRICGIYRTLSKEAPAVFTGLFPNELLPKRRIEIYEKKKAKKEIREATKENW